MKGRIHFDGEGHQRPPEDQHGAVTVRQQTIWIDGAKVTARNDGGWLHVVIETTDAMIGYAVTANGQPLPVIPGVYARPLSGGTGER